MVVYPPIAKFFGYRWTCRLLLVFLIPTCILIPFSNAITGPVPSNWNNTSASSNGSGWGEVWVGSGLNSTDYCGVDTAGAEGVINEDSIKRLPLLVWAVVTGGQIALIVLG